MSEQTYRICVSVTPAQLASEVTELLGQGWQLYGYPFADGEGDGNGHGRAQVFCQAMVRGEVSIAHAAPAAARTLTAETAHVALRVEAKPVEAKPVEAKPVAPQKAAAPKIVRQRP